MQTEKTEVLDNRIQELLSSGAHFGLSKTRRNPSVKNLILTNKNKTDIINLEETIKELDKVKKFLEGISDQGKKIIFIGTKPEVRDIVKKFAEQNNAFHMTKRWIGGTFTNLSEIKKRLGRLEEIKKSKEVGDINKYTKKEIGLMEKELEKLSEMFGGIIGMNELPSAVLLIDAKHEEIAKKEASKIGLPIIAITNTDTNIKGINYPIVANDSSISSVSTILSMLFNK